jgi:hypothetical protein
MSIAQGHDSCYSAFDKLCEAARDTQRHHRQFQDEFDKYSLWAGNLGAGHSGRNYELSLDYRLREASFYKDQVLLVTSSFSISTINTFTFCQSRILTKIIFVYFLQVGRLLSILRGQLQKAHQILIGERTPFEEFISEPEPDPAHSSQFQSQAPSTDDDSPWEVSSDSGSEQLSEQKPHTKQRMGTNLRNYRHKSRLHRTLQNSSSW